VLFCGSIYENVAMGIQDRSSITKQQEYETVKTSLENAYAWEFLSQFENGVYQEIGQSGTLLSGGQKQRIAIARALARDPDVLILDEATSALDNKSEKEVQNAIENIISNGSCTTISIAHRLSTVKNCHQIFVFTRKTDFSEITEKGTHQELMELNGVYCNMYSAQMLAGKEVEATHSPTTCIGEIAEELKDVPISTKETYREIYSKSIEISQEVRLSRLRNKMIELRSKRKTKREKGKAERSKLKGTTREILKTSFDRRYKHWFIGISAAVLCGCFFPLMPIINAQAVTMFIDGLNLSTCSDAYFKYVCSDTSHINKEFCNTNGGTFPPDTLPPGIESLLEFCDPSWNELKYNSKKWGLTYLVGAILTATIFCVRDYTFTGLGQDMMDYYRRSTFKTIINHDISFFDDLNNSAGALCNILSTDCKSIEGIISDNIWIYIQVFAISSLAIIVSFAMNWEIAVISLIQPLITIPASLQIARMLKQGRELEIDGGLDQSDYKQSSAFVPLVMSEITHNLTTICAYNLQPYMLRMFITARSKEIKLEYKKMLLTSLFCGFAGGMVYLANSLVFYYAGMMMIDITFGINPDRNHPLTIQKFITIFMLSTFLGQSLGTMIGAGSDTSRAREAYVRQRTVVEYKRLVDQELEVGKVLSTKDVFGAIDVKGLAFQYPTRIGVKVYHNVEFSTEGGKKIALIGPSGAGKSTFIQLFERFYTLRLESDSVNYAKLPIGDTCSGTILLDGVNIEDIDVNYLRSHIALVEQNPNLFSSFSIKENICMGTWGLSRQPTDEEITEACQLSGADAFIRSFPDQYDTIVVSGGANLSGGQKQKIAIARALIRVPKILLLDESTSALDSCSEREIMESLHSIRQRFGGLTSITIAHRLSTIMDSDVIICLNNLGDGSVVVEKGTHEELMDRVGLYSQLVACST